MFQSISLESQMRKDRAFLRTLSFTTEVKECRTLKLLVIKEEVFPFLTGTLDICGCVTEMMN